MFAKCPVFLEKSMKNRIYLPSIKKHEQELRIAKELAEKLLNYQERGELSEPFCEAFLKRMALRYGGGFKLPGF